jgi:hypothetical protein
MIWYGDDELRDYLVPVDVLSIDKDSSVEDLQRVEIALASNGQIRPVLVGFSGTDVTRHQHILEAAIKLGWTHVAVRQESAMSQDVSPNQTTLLDDAEFASTTATTVAHEVSSDEVANINDLSSDAEYEWGPGQALFVEADKPFLVVVSCETENDRDALLECLGIDIIHKKTRGTFSTWWPNKARKDLVSLRFVTDESNETGFQGANRI